MQLIVHTTGTGTKTIALLHGISGEAAMFADLTAILAERFDATVLGVDLRGHGDSSRAGSYTFDEFADDVVDTLPAGLDVVMGHSLGGGVLLRAVSRLLPGKAVYLDPAFVAPEATTELASRANVSEHEDGSPFSEEELAAVNPGWGHVNLQRAMHSHAKWDASMFEQVMADVQQASAPDQPPVVPSLVLLAENSPLVDDALSSQLGELGFEVRVQADAGHNLHLDDVEATIRALDGWI
jgi:pimeloyl-ACP methyl ester carboxylesterase